MRRGSRAFGLQAGDLNVQRIVRRETEPALDPAWLNRFHNWATLWKAKSGRFKARVRWSFFATTVRQSESGNLHRCRYRESTWPGFEIGDE